MSAKELFTIVKHEPRVKYGLSYVDYCLADTIYHLANNKNNKLDGWCYKSKENLAIQLGVSRSTIQTSILKLIANKWVIKNQYGHLRTTKKWEDSVIHSKVTGQSVKKLHTKKTDLRTSDCVKTTPYNYSEKDNDKGFSPEKLIPSSTNKVERESTMVLQSVKDIFHAEYQSYPTIGAKEKAAAKRAIKELGVKDTLLLVEEWFDSSKVHPDIKPQIMAIFPLTVSTNGKRCCYKSVDL
jgi:predicted transcriptional regulator